MKHFQHIRIAILAAICVFAIGRLHSESLADREPRLVSGEVLPIDLDDTLADETLSLLDTRKSLVSKEETLIDESLCIIDSGGFEIGAYRSSVQGNRENVRRSPYASSSLPVQGDPYYNGYGAYLEAVASTDPLAREAFVAYFSDWQRSGQEKGFLPYTKDRAEQERRLALCYDAALKKFGAGTAIVAATWIIACMVPGGGVCHAAVMYIARGTTAAAFGGGVIGALFSAGVSLIQGKRGSELLYATVNGAADGFLLGAVTGLATETFAAVHLFADAIAVSGKIYTTSGLVFDANGGMVGRVIRFASIDAEDGIYYIGKKSATVFDKTGKEVAKIAKVRNRYVLYRENGRIVGYLGKDMELVSYCDPYSPAMVKGQWRAAPGQETKLAVQELAKRNGQFNPRTGRFLDAVDGQEIVGVPEMGHANGHEYVNELQRAYVKGLSEDEFRSLMKDPSIYRLESQYGNRSHLREAPSIGIDSFPGVKKEIEGELWKALSTL